MKVKNKVEQVDDIEQIEYRAIINIKRYPYKVTLSLTEMETISEMWQDFKKQSGFKKL